MPSLLWEGHPYQVEVGPEPGPVLETMKPDPLWDYSVDSYVGLQPSSCLKKVSQLVPCAFFNQHPAQTPFSPSIPPLLFCRCKEFGRNVDKVSITELLPLSSPPSSPLQETQKPRGVLPELETGR